MKIERVTPPETQFTLVFTRDEGWALVGALTEYAHNHAEAVHQGDWLRWAGQLDKELRRP